MTADTNVRPNVLIVMTDEERYTPPYEADELAEFRRTQLPARHALRSSGLELQRHYVASTACLPSRASLFTGQYPSLHGVRFTDGLAKPAVDPSMHWLDPNTVPTMGDWFRSAGYRTQYRGKWHISHPDLLIPGTHNALRTNDRDGNVWAHAADAYRRADRLEPFGFGGWIGSEPHGPNPANTGFVRDGIFADQVCEMIDQLATSDDGPWLAVASFVNPHDIAFSGMAWAALGFPPIDEAIPHIPEAPSQAESLEDRPTAQREFRAVWPKMLFDQPADMTYRRFYHWLHVLVDAAIARVLDALDASGMGDDTIVVFTSDHGDQLGAHGGLQQKWYQAYEETLRVPMVVRGPGIDTSRGPVEIPTSHIDVLPTLLGLVDADVADLEAEVSVDHVETHALAGRDLSPLLRGTADPDALDAPVYFRTEDQMTRGMRLTSQVTGAPFEPVREPANLESVITTTGGGNGDPDLWKLTRYFESDTDDSAAPEQWEAYNLSDDPQERANLAADGLGAELDELRALLTEERTRKRLLPAMGDRGV